MGPQQNDHGAMSTGETLVIEGHAARHLPPSRRGQVPRRSRGGPFGPSAQLWRSLFRISGQGHSQSRDGDANGGAYPCWEGPFLPSRLRACRLLQPHPTEAEGANLAERGEAVENPERLGTTVVGADRNTYHRPRQRAYGGTSSLAPQKCHNLSSAACIGFPRGESHNLLSERADMVAEAKPSGLPRLVGTGSGGLGLLGVTSWPVSGDDWRRPRRPARCADGYADAEEGDFLRP